MPLRHAASSLWHTARVLDGARRLQHRVLAVDRRIPSSPATCRHRTSSGTRAARPAKCASRPLTQYMRDRTGRVGVAVREPLQPFVRALGADARRHPLEEPQHRRPHRREHGVVLVPFRLIGMPDAVPLLHRRFGDRAGLETDQRVRNLVGRRGREPRRAISSRSVPSLRRPAVVADDDARTPPILREGQRRTNRDDACQKKSPQQALTCEMPPQSMKARC